MITLGTYGKALREELLTDGTGYWKSVLSERDMIELIEIAELVHRRRLKPYNEAIQEGINQRYMNEQEDLRKSVIDIKHDIEDVGNLLRSCSYMVDQLLRII